MYTGFPHDLIEKVKCPREGSDLRLVVEKSENNRVITGHVACPECSAKHHISDGILDLSEIGREVGDEMKREIVARDEGAKEYDSFTDQDWYRLEIPTAMKHLTGIDGKDVIEFGSGTGRFTIEIIKKSKSLLAVDFSRLSHVILGKQLSEDDNVGLILGDVTKVAFKKGAFDIAVSTQVLEHIPSRKLRNDFLRIVDDCLKPEAYFLCTAYYQDMRRRMMFQPREGFHESGIFFHYFNKRELQQELSCVFKIVHLNPFLFHFPLIWRLQFKYPWLIRLFEKTPFLKEFGSLAIIKAIKKAG